MRGISEFYDYWVDSAQRSVLFWDVLRERGNNYLDHREQGKPPVLVYDFETVLDGRALARPVNYALLRIVPPAGEMFDPSKRPYVIIDPRAGHGPGIGGFKRDSQIGVAQRAGHPVYFVMFFPEPEAGQTLEDIGHAEARFLEEVALLHPDAPKSCVVGNCQAGWAVTMLASVAPELMGLIVLNGAPLSYWAGVDGQNPMRYLGGLSGGAWLASFMSDIGAGKFDGAQLVANFENLNPGHTLWGKPYQLYSNIDHERDRFLDFERWWGGFFFLNEEEMESIVEDLFVGNRLQTGDLSLSDGTPLDLRNIRAPIVIFASEGDNITPPQQALNWIVDVYESVDEIVANGQVIVYLLHESIGHLGIFVSGKVAQKEHSEIIDTMDFFDLLPPGLYEMQILDNETDQSGERRYRVRFEERTISDIRSLDDDQVDTDYFTSFKAVSEFNNLLYKVWLRPWIKALVSDQSAETMRNLHPQRVQRYLLSDANPLCLWLAPAAEWVRSNRREAADDNLFKEWERDVSRSIEVSFDAFRVTRDAWVRLWYKTVYGPTGLGAFTANEPAASSTADGRVERCIERIEPEMRRLKERETQGGFVEATMRMLLLLSRADGVVERRIYRAGQQMATTHPRLRDLQPGDYKRIAREQYLLTRLDRGAAIDGLAEMLPQRTDREEAAQIIHELLWTHRQPNTAEREVIEDIERALDMRIAA